MRELGDLSVDRRVDLENLTHAVDCGCEREPLSVREEHRLVGAVRNIGHLRGDRVIQGTHIDLPCPTTIRLEGDDVARRSPYRVPVVARVLRYAARPATRDRHPVEIPGTVARALERNPVTAGRDRGTGIVVHRDLRRCPRPRHGTDGRHEEEHLPTNTERGPPFLELCSTHPVSHPHGHLRAAGRCHAQCPWWSGVFTPDGPLCAGSSTGVKKGREKELLSRF